MSEEGLDHLVYSKNVIEFVTVANEYCSFIENSSDFRRSEFIDRLHKIFPLLYLKACLLPDVDDDNIETPEKFLSEIDYNFLLNKVSSMLAQFDSYHEVFDEGMQFSETAIEANLSENICDIYQDLKDFLLTFRIGTVELMMDALWECKNNFSNYWGQKLVNGLRALHAVRYGDVEIDEEEPKLTRNKSEKDLNVADDWVSKHFNNYLEGEDKTDNDV